MSDVRGGTVTNGNSTTIAKKPWAQIQEEEYKAPDTMLVDKNVIDFDTKFGEIYSVFLHSRPSNNGHSFSVP